MPPTSMMNSLSASSANASQEMMPRISSVAITESVISLSARGSISLPKSVIW